VVEEGFPPRFQPWHRGGGPEVYSRGDSPVAASKPFSRPLAQRCRVGRGVKERLAHALCLIIDAQGLLKKAPWLTRYAQKGHL